MRSLIVIVGLFSSLAFAATDKKASKDKTYHFLGAGIHYDINKVELEKSSTNQVIPAKENWLGLSGIYNMLDPSGFLLTIEGKYTTDNQQIDGPTTGELTNLEMTTWSVDMTFNHLFRLDRADGRLRDPKRSGNFIGAGFTFGNFRVGAVSTSAGMTSVAQQYIPYSGFLAKIGYMETRSDMPFMWSFSFDYHNSFNHDRGTVIALKDFQTIALSFGLNYAFE